jgi:hypothetical protein
MGVCHGIECQFTRRHTIPRILGYDATYSEQEELIVFLGLRSALNDNEAYSLAMTFNYGLFIFERVASGVGLYFWKPIWR